MANFTENIGVNYCGLIASKKKWLYRPQPVNDIGIDAHMEFVDSSDKPKQLIALQIKSGESYFNETKNDFVVFRDMTERQYNYWVKNSLPCILVLYNPDNELCIWEELSEKTICRTKNGEGKGYYVNVHLKNIFIDNESHEKFLSLSNLPEHIVNYNFLLSQKIFMKIIHDGGTVKLHSTEWIHKSSGRGTTELIIETDGGQEKYSYPYWFPYTPYEEVFPRLFPWASFSADEDFFEKSDEELWRELHCYYDKEDDEWINVGDSFDEFRAKLSPMRYIEHSGEVAEYMMVLELNELGEAFLSVDDYVSQKQPYVMARPSEGNGKNEED